MPRGSNHCCFAANVFFALIWALLSAGSIDANASDPPTMVRISPGGSSVEVTTGDSIQFSAEATAAAGIMGIEWFQGSSSIRYTSYTGSWDYYEVESLTRTFNSPGSYTIAAYVYDRHSPTREAFVYWNVDVADPPPPAPTGVSATDGTYPDRVRISWSSSSGASSYEVWRSTSNNSGSATRIQNNHSSTAYDDYGASAGTTYYYWIRAKNSSGTSAFSASDSGYVTPPPPEMVRLYPGGSSVSITAGDSVEFSAEATAAAGIMGIEWFQGNSSLRYNSYTGSWIYYKEESLNRTFNSPGSYTIYAYVYDRHSSTREDFVYWNVDVAEPPPPAPTGVSASDGTYPDHVSISWTSSSGATSYEVWRSTSNNSGSATQIASNHSTTSYDDYGASPGTTYYYWVKAKNSHGTSGFSAGDSGYPTPPPPEMARLHPGGSSVDIVAGDSIDFSAAATASAGIQGIEWFQGSSSLRYNSYTGSWIYYKEESLNRTFNSSGIFTIYAYVYDRHTPSREAFVHWDVDVAEPPPPAPTGVSASDGTYPDHVSISWTSSSGATSYEVWRSTSSDSGSATQIANNQTTTTYDDYSAAPETTYHYWIKAKNSHGTSGFSAGDSGFLTPPPPEMQRLHPGTANVEVTTGESIDFSAAATASAGIKGIEWFQGSSSIRYNDYTGSWIYYKEEILSRTFDSAGTYTIYAYVYDRHSPEREAFVYWEVDVVEPPPPPPTNVSASQGEFPNQVQATWTASDGATSYEVWRHTSNSPGSATLVQQGIQTTSFNDQAVADQTIYYYWVKAVSAHGASDFSHVASGYTTPPPPEMHRITPSNSVVSGQAGDSVYFSSAAVASAGIEGIEWFVDSASKRYKSYTADWNYYQEESFEWQFNYPGEYIVSAYVYDRQTPLQEAFVTWQVEIAQAQAADPTLAKINPPGASASYFPDQSIPFTVAASSDGVELAQLRFSVNGIEQTAMSLSGVSQEVTWDKIFSDPGAYLVSVEVTDETGGTSTANWEIVINDPGVANIEDFAVRDANDNPDWLAAIGAGNSQPLLTGGTPRKGATTDGVTKLLLRAQVSEPTEVEFCLAGASALEGRLLDIVTLEPSTDCLSVSSIQSSVTGEHYAVVLYETPEVFETDLESPKMDWVYRNVLISAQTPNGSVSSKTIELHRPALMFVHGLWSKEDTWEYDIWRPDTSDARFKTYFVDYSDTSASAFAVNSQNLIEPAVEEALTKHHEAEIASTQVDVVAHSMGGILARLRTQQSGFIAAGNWEQGEFNRLITLDTPHFGSPWADFLLSVRDGSLGDLGLTTFLRNAGLPVDEDPNDFGATAIDDLAMFSDALLEIESTAVPSHAVIGDYFPLNPDAVIPQEIAPLCFVMRLTGVGLDCPDEVAGVGSDAIVSEASQSGGIATAFSTTITHPQALHLRNTSSAEYRREIFRLLHTRPSGNEFSEFPPVAAHEDDSMRVRFSRDMRGSASDLEVFEDAIVFVSPQDGDEISSGETLSVVLDVSSENVEEVMVAGRGFSGTSVEQPFEIALDVPSSAIGATPLMALGYDSEGNVYTSSEIQVQVIPQATLQELSVHPETVSLDVVGNTRNLTVVGRYDDGVTRNISDASTGTGYSVSDPSVAIVSDQGKIEAVGEGQTEISITHEGQSVMVPVGVGAPVDASASLVVEPSMVRLFGTDDQRTLVLTNVGEEDLQLTSIDLSGTGFELIDGSCALGVAIPRLSSCTIQVQFNGAEAQLYDGHVEIGSNSSDGTALIPLRASGPGFSVRIFGDKFEDAMGFD